MEKIETIQQAVQLQVSLTGEAKEHEFYAQGQRAREAAARLHDAIAELEYAIEDAADYYRRYTDTADNPAVTSAYAARYGLAGAM